MWTFLKLLDAFLDWVAWAIRGLLSGGRDTKDLARRLDTYSKRVDWQGVTHIQYHGHRRH